MAVTVNHAFSSAKSDGSDATQVQPSHWNAAHTVSGLGTAAEKNTGTSGNVVPLLDGANTFSATNVFNGLLGFTGGAVAGNRVTLAYSQDEHGLYIGPTHATFTQACLSLNVTRAANSGYNFLHGMSGNFGDTEFLLKGDGNGLCDGSFTGGGADYAEYFEWEDGNPNGEDRRGYSVKLVGNKIALADEGAEIIGAISGNPSIIGDAAWNKWSEKHLRDDFGSYILDKKGNRKVNPKFKKDEAYVPRAERKEWDCVGLIGKLRIRKGQPVGDRWIKMRDVSAAVEEWLVR